MSASSPEANISLQIICYLSVGYGHFEASFSKSNKEKNVGRSATSQSVSKKKKKTLSVPLSSWWLWV